MFCKLGIAEFEKVASPDQLRWTHQANYEEPSSEYKLCSPLYMFTGSHLMDAMPRKCVKGLSGGRPQLFYDARWPADASRRRRHIARFAPSHSMCKQNNQISYDCMLLNGISLRLCLKSYRQLPTKRDGEASISEPTRTIDTRGSGSPPHLPHPDAPGSVTNSQNTL